MNFIEANKDLSIVVTIHALERFAERVLKQPTPENRHMYPEVMNHIQQLIHEDMQENHNYIYDVGSGICNSSEFNCIYVVKDFKVHTVKIKSKEGFRETNGGKIKTNCKNSKYMKKRLNEYKK